MSKYIELIGADEPAVSIFIDPDFMEVIYTIYKNNGTKATGIVLSSGKKRLVRNDIEDVMKLTPKIKWKKFTHYKDGNNMWFNVDAVTSFGNEDEDGAEIILRAAYTMGVKEKTAEIKQILEVA